MTNFLPLLNSTNRFPTVVPSYAVESSKRKCVALAQKAAPTCTLSLTSVSVSAHGSSDFPDFIPFPSCPATTTPGAGAGATIPFPSTTPILVPTSPTKVTVCPRPRLRSQSSLLRRRRSTARLVQPVSCTTAFPCSSQVESEPDQLSSSTPPRKRARKTSISTPSSSIVFTKPTYHSLVISSSAQKKAKSSKKAAADLRFLCTMYRSIAWLRLQRDFAQATRCFLMDRAMAVTESSLMMDVDDSMVPMRVSVLDAQESLLLSRLRSYLIFNETSPQWLDVTPLHSTLPTPSFAQEVEERMDMDVDVRGSNHYHHPTPTPTSTSPPLPPTPTPTPHLPIISQGRVAASLVFRYRHRSKGKSRPEAPIAAGTGDGEERIARTRRSPLAGPDACWVPEEL